MSYNMNPPGTSSIINNMGGQFDNPGYFEDAILQGHNQDGQMHTEDWLSKPDRPWTLVQPAPTSGPPAVSAPEYLTSGSNPNSFYLYRNNACSLSECDTVPGDSGYGGSCMQTSIENTSVFGEDHYNTTDQDVDPELNFHLNIQDPDHSYNVSKFDSGPSRGGTDHGKLWCSGCNTSVRTQSELNKHKQRHDRPYTCTEKDCKRQTFGFASQNDLVRHQRSVHKQHQLLGKTFVCHHDPCRTKEQKKWPRADNFRSHLQRVHKLPIQADDDLSEYLYKEPVSNGFHEDLSGVGTGPNLQRPVMPSGGQDIIPGQHFSNPSIGGFSGIPSPLSATLPAHDFPSSSNMPFYNEKSSMAPLPSNLDYQPTQSSSPYRSEKASPKSRESQARSPIIKDARRGSRPSQNRSQPSRAIKGEPSTSAPVVKMASGQTKALKRDATASLVTNKGLDSKALGKASFQECPPSHGNEGTAFNASSLDVHELLRKLPRHMLEEALASVTDSEDIQMGPASDTNKECPTCHKIFARPCELRKHVRRHERPYACTVYKCDKRFGSKNDWKRHETGQHNQPEVWFCPENCNKIFNRRETLEHHLRRSHGMSSEEEIHEKLESNRRGGHCVGIFWCGFCNEFIKVTSGESASDQRFNHIDGHFMGREGVSKGRIEDWMYMEERLEESNQSTELGRKRKLSRQSNPRPAKQPYMHRP